VVRPAEVEGQRASALRFGDKRVQALFAVLVVFSLQLRGFNNREMRVLLAQLLGLDPANYPIGRMTYDLRRLRLHGIGVAVVFERKVALRNKSRVVSHLRTQDDVFGRQFPKFVDSRFLS
jgi:hypothetical protein